MNNSRVAELQEQLNSLTARMYSGGMSRAEYDVEANKIRAEITAEELKQAPQQPTPVQQSPQTNTKDITELSLEDLEKIIDNIQDPNAIYMNDPVPGITINGVQAGFGDIQNAYTTMLAHQKEAEEQAKETAKDPVMVAYANAGYGQNADGHYFDPSKDEYDEKYDPHNDPLFNAELAKQEAKDPVMEAYRNAGYGQNADGHYFDPSKDEYDENYDPHNDPLFNPDLQNKKPVNEFEGKSHDELFKIYAQACNEMADILKIEPYPGIELEDYLDSTKYKLDDDEKARFAELKGILDKVNAVDNTVKPEYTDVMNEIKSIRGKMGTILGMEPYPGIENERYSDLSFQLEPDEKQEFEQLATRMSVLKGKYPDLFKNVQQTKGMSDTQPQPQPQPDQSNTQGTTGGNGTDGNNGNNDGNNNGDSGNNGTDNPTDDQTQTQGQTQGGDGDNGDGNDQDQAQEDEEDKDKDDEQNRTQAENEQLRQIIAQQQKREKVTKWLLRASGFVTGAALSCVPGVGTIRMVAAGVKLGASAINFISKKFPNSAIAKVKDKFETKHPKITGFVKKFNEKLHMKPINYLLQGVSAGYLVGNLWELGTGNTLWEQYQQWTHTPQPTVATVTPVGPQAPAGPTTPTPAAPQTPDVPDLTTVEAPTGPSMDELTDMVKSGQGLDISGIEYGKVSSDAQNAVHLLQSRGQGVTFLREVTLPDGKVMWAFNQANGAGYAWFDSQDILNYLSENAPEMAETVMKR